MGNVCVALYNSSILMLRQTKKPIIYYIEAAPVTVLALPRHVAKPTSNKPAMMRRIQFMVDDCGAKILMLGSGNYRGFKSGRYKALDKIVYYSCNLYQRSDLIGL